MSIIIFVFALIISLTSKVQAEEASPGAIASCAEQAGVSCSQNYVMEVNGEDNDPNDPTITTFNTSTLRSTPRLRGSNYTNANKIISAKNTAIKMRIDKLWVDFGGITPGIFASNTNTITISIDEDSSFSPMGYALYAAENHSPYMLEDNQRLLNSTTLKPFERQVIPNTSCNGGADTCNLFTAAIWDNPDQAGFGYTVTCNDKCPAFANGTRYKAFADLSDDVNPQAAQLIAYQDVPSRTLTDRHVNIKYQVSAANENEAGVYTNSIYYTLIPTY